MLIKVSLLMAVLSPIIMQYLNLGMNEFWSLSFLIYIWSLSVSLIKRVLNVQLSKWSFRLSIALLVSLSYGYFWFVLNGFSYWAAYGLAIGILILVIRKVFKKSKHFEREIELDRELRNKVLQLILMQSAHIGAPDWMVQSKARSSKKPWIFRKSQKLFTGYTPEIGYQELIIKLC
nr:ABC transporter permease [Piscibacillus salipiscarius]